MPFFTSQRGGNSQRLTWLALTLFFCGAGLLLAQPETNAGLPGPGEMSADTNLPAVIAPPAPVLPPAPVETPAPVVTPPRPAPTATLPDLIPGALMTLASLVGFLLYQCGLTRAKNSAHTSALLLIGVLFALTGYWIGGFAVQTGGIGDAHAALAEPLPPAESSSLDHELGVMAGGHHWGFMGSAGFFLASDDQARTGIATLFLMQAALLALAVAAALGAALERGKLLAMGFCAALIGVLIYPFFANWVWGGGWLAELGRNFGLGHGFTDLAGASVVHETAGTLALVLAVVLGPRHGRFGRGKSNLIPGHNVPFIILGSIVLLVSWMATNAAAGATLVADSPEAGSSASVASVNTLLAAMAGLAVTFLVTRWEKRRPEPARLCRGLLGGAVASFGGAGVIDPWAAFVIGGVAALLVETTVNFLERKRIDDPVGAAAMHGAGGAWGALAVGLFANGATGVGYNGVDAPIRGLFFGGAWHQLAAQALGVVTCFVVVYILGYAGISLVHKLLGNRVALAAETAGLDLAETGVLGYQGDIEPEE